MPTGSDPRSDEALVAAHVAGDPRAFDELVRRHTPRLWPFAVRTLGDAHDAADALQEAWISALRGVSGWRGDARVGTWLRRIVYHACLDRVRRHRNRRADPLDEETDVPLARDPMADRVTVLEVDEALARLPFDQRAAVVLVDMEGLSVAEAAEVLGIKVGTVKSRAARARYRLAVLLGHLQTDDDPDDGTDLGTDVAGEAPEVGASGNRRAAGGVGIRGRDVPSGTGGG